MLVYVLCAGLGDLSLSLEVQLRLSSPCSLMSLPHLQMASPAAALLIATTQLSIIKVAKGTLGRTSAARQLLVGKEKAMQHRVQLLQHLLLHLLCCQGRDL